MIRDKLYRNVLFQGYLIVYYTRCKPIFIHLTILCIINNNYLK